MTRDSRITTDVDQAVCVLLRGGIIGLHTETVYGLAAVADNQEAVMRVFDTKDRPTSHPLIVHLGTNVNKHEWGIFNEAAEALAQAFWPGPLTLLVPRTTKVPDWVTGGRETVAIRVPIHPVAMTLLNNIGTGVVAPSANRFGRVSPTTAQHVEDDLGTDVDLILDGGPCDVGVESTIVECVGDEVRILRPGVIGVEDIQRVVTLSQTAQEEESRAPGMLASHYAPRAEILLFETLSDAASHVATLHQGGRSARVLHYEDDNVYAEHLYSELRQADQDSIEVICAVLPSASGIGLAIRDRLGKAAHH